jgi:hypothetical protein
VEGKSRELLVGSNDFLAMCEAPLSRLAKILSGVFLEAGLSPSSISGVLLAGGAAKTSMIRAFLAKAFGRFPSSPIAPEHVAALGAGLAACGEDNPQAFSARAQAGEDPPQSMRGDAAEAFSEAAAGLEEGCAPPSLYPRKDMRARHLIAWGERLYQETLGERRAAISCRLSAFAASVEAGKGTDVAAALFESFLKRIESSEIIY